MQMTHPRSSFHLLRFLLAVLIVLTHCYTLVGLPTPLNRLTGGQMNEGTLAVDGFLILSGYLVTGSVLRCRHIGTFLRNRFLRIWPALTCALVFTAIIGGISYQGSWADYLRPGDGGPWHYIRHWLTLNFQAEPWNITGVFAANRVQGVNVPLWTIKHEVSLYLILAVFMLLRLQNRKPVYWSFYGAFLGMQVLYAGFGVQLWSLRTVQAWVLNHWNYARFLETGTFFFAGALLWLYKDRLPRKCSIALGCVTALLLGGAFGVMRWIHLFATPYLLWYAGTSPRGDRLSCLGDLSFGLYVYSYPVQQLLLERLPGIQPAAHFAMTLALVLPIAYFSFIAIEKPALALKDVSFPRKRRPNVMR